MYWDNERTKSSLVKYYWAPEGAEFFPHPIIYTSETWDTCHWYAEGAGEDRMAGYSYYNGAIPGPFKGKHSCGPKEWWMNGCPSDAPPLPRNSQGLPACCFDRGAYSSAYSTAWDALRGKID